MTRTRKYQPKRTVDGVMMTEKTARVYEFCKREVAAGRPFPAPAVINARMGWGGSGSAAQGSLMALKRDGLVNLIIEDRGTGRVRYRYIWSLANGRSAQE